MDPDVRSVWFEMLQDVGVAGVEKLVKKYNAQSSISMASMNNH